MTTFWQSVIGCAAVIGFVIALPNAIRLLAELAEQRGRGIEYRHDQETKRPPFHHIELVECPNLEMVSIHCFKDLGDGPEVVLVTSTDLPPWLYRRRTPTRFDVGGAKP